MTVYTVWNGSIPAGTSSVATGARSDGLQFKANSTCTLTGIAYYVPTGETTLTGSSYAARIYSTTTGTSGTLLNSATGSGTFTAGAWNWIPINQALTAGTSYVAVVDNPDLLQFEHNYWSPSGSQTDITVGPITVPDETDALGGIQQPSGTAGAFPANVNGSWYGIDVQVTTGITFPNTAGDITTAAGVSGTLTMAPPANTANGDLLIAWIADRNTLSGTPSGWTLAQNWSANGLYAAYYLAVPSASSLPANWSWTVGTRNAAVMFRVTGCDMTTPVVGVGASPWFAGADGGGSLPLVLNGVTAAGGSVALIGTMWQGTGPPSTHVPGYTQIASVNGAGGASGIGAFGAAGSGATGNITTNTGWTVAGNGEDGILLALNAAGGSSTNISVSDFAGQVESLAITNTLAAQDFAGAVESFLAALFISVSDYAGGVESRAITATIPVVDYAGMVESITGSIGLAVSDFAGVVDHLVNSGIAGSNLNLPAIVFVAGTYTGDT